MREIPIITFRLDVTQNNKMSVKSNFTLKVHENKTLSKNLMYMTLSRKIV